MQEQKAELVKKGDKIVELQQKMGQMLEEDTLKQGIGL